MYIDFAELKTQVTIADVAELLDLQLTEGSDQLRGPCPRCQEEGERALAITPAKSVFYCFGAKRGGDCIALAAHIRDCSMRDAALYIHDKLVVARDDGDQVIDTGATMTDTSDAPALKPLTYLHHEHEAVQALGIDAKTAEVLGIGYAKKGIMRGRVAIPLRGADGTLMGYCGYSPENNAPLKFPPNLTSP